MSTDAVLFAILRYKLRALKSVAKNTQLSRIRSQKFTSLSVSLVSLARTKYELHHPSPDEPLFTVNMVIEEFIWLATEEDVRLAC